MAWTYDVATDVGKVRLLTPDKDSSNPIFDDAEIQAFLDLSGGSVQYAAARVLDTIANSDAYILKVTRVLDVSVDGTRVADALHKGAELLRKEAALTEPGSSMDWAEQVFTPWGENLRLYNERLRAL